MTRSVAPDQIDVFGVVRLITDADGTPATGVVAATAGHRIWYRRELAALVTDGTSAADLASLTTAHTDWEFLEIANGYYTVAYPDAAFANGVGGVLLGMDATGISCVAEYMIIDSFLKYQGKPSSATATTTTFPASTNPYQGDEIYVVAGTGARQTRVITSVSGQVATHEAFGVAISATTSTIALIPGHDTAVDIDAGVADIQSRIPAALSTQGNIKSDIEEVNEVTVTGTGTESDPWVP